MEAICAVIDVQGFLIGAKFFPAEVCLVSEFDMTNIRVNPGIPWKEISLKDRRDILWIERYHHGIPYDAPASAYTLDEAIGVVKTFYSMTTSKEKNLIGCKSKVALDFITECGIPGINLTSEGATWKKLASKLKGREPCHFHREATHNKQLKCSMVGTLVLWNWVKEKVNGNTDVWWDYPFF